MSIKPKLGGFTQSGSAPDRWLRSRPESFGVGMTQQRYLAMRQKARQLIDDHYTWASMTERIAQAYQKIVEGLAHA